MYEPNKENFELHNIKQRDYENISLQANKRLNVIL